MTLHEKAKHYESEASTWKAFALQMLQGTIRWSEWERREAFNRTSPDFEIRYALLPSGVVIVEARYTTDSQSGGNYTRGVDGFYHTIRRTADAKEKQDLTDKYFPAVEVAR